MNIDMTTKPQKVLSRRISIGLAIAAVALGLVALYHTNRYPRTDDSEILANFIGIAPQVDGRLIDLHVRDNQFAKKGELLYEIDERPFRYALETALSEQAALEGQIADEQ
jgi:multidrug efflux system membrane fusion protein